MDSVGKAMKEEFGDFNDKYFTRPQNQAIEHMDDKKKEKKENKKEDKKQEEKPKDEKKEEQPKEGKKE